MSKLKTQGRPPKHGERMTARIAVPTGEALKERVRKVAARQGITMAEWVRLLLAETLGD